MNRDVLEIIRNSSFDRNALNQHADETGSGRAAVDSVCEVLSKMDDISL